MKEFRAAIIRMHERRTGKREIGRLLGIDESTVRKAIKRFEETGSNDNRKREKTARSSRNIQRAKGMIKRNATTKVNSTRKLAKKLGVSQESARQILRTDLKPYKLQKRQKLSAAARLKRLQRARALFRRFSNGRHRQIVFSDEKLFTIQQASNHQSDRIWAEEAPDTEERAVERTQKAESVMVWAAISARGKSPPLDYSIWSILEEKACSKPHPNLESLKKALKKAWKEINLETLINTVDDFPKRLEACIAANGGYFE
uniref:Transposase n=1 Tax=Acrobeloides nanus TaxID=290746 RepID=A0A914EF83_9BILA